ncbi:MAG: FkbM family methyltransferase [Flavobacteriales bacterium]|nr:FkbM family methyltransferase [Flavobacteriales bacterium]MCB9193846.1 FkbM family methyltransferase [Flavobacteriales bacterium]
MRTIKRSLKQFGWVRRLLNLRDRARKRDLAERARSGRLLDLLTPEDRERWMPRIHSAQASADNQYIRHVPDAGTFNANNDLVMHNGLLIDPQSYYGVAMLELLVRNRGVHEPQEEYAFQEVLADVPEGGVMVELGAYWSFYSMWFHARIRGARNYMVEPEHLEAGIRNFQLNGMIGDFTRAYVSDCAEAGLDPGTVPTICLDRFVLEKGIRSIDILHADIQGYEHKMLLGAETLLNERRVGYLFISTHSQDLHERCRHHLEGKGYVNVCAADLEGSYSHDGLLVFREPGYGRPRNLVISSRRARNGPLST